MILRCFSSSCAQWIASRGVTIFSLLVTLQAIDDDDDDDNSGDDDDDDDCDDNDDDDDDDGDDDDDETELQSEVLLENTSYPDPRKDIGNCG